MLNVQQTMLIKMNQILKSPSLHNLPLGHQFEIVNAFCTFLNKQIKDIRLRCERSNIRKGVKDIGRIRRNDENRRPDEAILCRIVYSYLFSFFKWESNFLRSLPRKVTEDVSGPHISQDEDENKKKERKNKIEKVTNERLEEQ